MALIVPSGKETPKKKPVGRIGQPLSLSDLTMPTPMLTPPVIGLGDMSYYGEASITTMRDFSVPAVPAPFPGPGPEKEPETRVVVPASHESLHDDFGMHEYEGIYAQMVDGRTVQLAPDAHGHMQIVKVIDDPNEPPEEKEQPAPGDKEKSEKGLAEALRKLSKAEMERPEGGWGPTDEMDDKRSLEIGRKTYQKQDSVFLAKLNNIMNDNQFDRRLKGRSRGKLDMTRLYKAETGSTSVFTQKSLRKNKKYNVVLVVDESGSMEGSKIETAGMVTQFLATHLDKVPGVNLAVLGFNHFQRLHKDFDQKIDLTTLKDSVMKAIESGAGHNADYNALERAYDLLKGRDGRNLVIFMSDGHPATGGNDMPCCDGGAKYREINGRIVDVDNIPVVNALVRHNEKLAKTVGVGILVETNQVPHNITARGLAALKPQIIDILSKEIKRG